MSILNPQLYFSSMRSAVKYLSLSIRLNLIEYLRIEDVLCDNAQRLDLYNGLLLLPNYDKLFDKGYISFDSRGNLISSSLLDKEVKEILGIKDGLSLRKLDDRHMEYLKYHNEYRFMG